MSSWLTTFATPDRFPLEKELLGELPPDQLKMVLEKVAERLEIREWMTSRPGDVVLVRFPFTDLSAAKLRPAVVLATCGDDLTIVGIFSASSM